jgi:hypothetical protein
VPASVADVAGLELVRVGTVTEALLAAGLGGASRHETTEPVPDHRSNASLALLS